MSLFDENAEVLRELASRGRDLQQPRSIDFAHVFSDGSSAREFADAARGEGFEVAVEEVDRETNSWDVVVSKVMVPTCENITQAEEHLSALAQGYGGHTDGWGFFSK